MADRTPAGANSQHWCQDVGYELKFLGLRLATLVSASGRQILVSSEIDGTGSRVSRATLRFREITSECKLNLLRDTGWRLKVSGSRGL